MIWGKIVSLDTIGLTFYEFLTELHPGVQSKVREMTS